MFLLGLRWAPGLIKFTGILFKHFSFFENLFEFCVSFFLTKPNLYTTHFDTIFDIFSGWQLKMAFSVFCNNSSPVLN